MSDSLIIFLIFLVYVGGLIYIIFSNSKAQTFEDFAVAGRSFSWPFIAMTIIGTSFAGSLLTGQTQFGHDVGMVTTYFVASCIMGLYLFAIICGPLWKVGKKYNVKTLGEFLELRYGSKRLRIFVGAALLLVEFPWIVTELLASGYAVQILTNKAIPFNMGMIIIAVLFTIYVLFAGMRAVIFADYYQGWIFILCGLTLFMTAMFVHFGSWENMWIETRNFNEELLTVPGNWWGEVPGPMVYTSLILIAAFGAYMYPSLFSRIFAASSPKELKASLNVTPAFTILFAIAVFLVSVGTSSLSQYGVEDSAYAFLEFVSSLGPVATALVAIIILAGSLSMMDSMLGSWAIVITNDIITPLKPEISSETQIKIARIFTVIVACLGVAVAMMELPMIIQIVTRVYQVIVQAFPLVIFGLFWKKGNLYGAWAGLLVGFTVCIYTQFTLPDYIPALGGLQGGVVGLILNFIVYIAFSLVSEKGRGSEELFATYKERL